MITNNDLTTLNLSPTNKDYYQVWAELIDTASKLSERWDPTSTNESDPGIVLLKVLTAIADKLNYNIDKNILEAFMPTAAQEESMKRLCDMLGYHINYYQSATTDVIIRYLGNVVDMSSDNTERLPDGNNEDKITGLLIPAFTAISNEDKSIYYLTTQDVTLTNEETLVTVPCIEGQRIRCETGDSTIITKANLDINNRYYLPENQVAENGIFVYGTVNGVHTSIWKKVDNLNIMPNNTKVFAFCIDSKENRPYLQFPADVSFLLEDGLEIYYIRTSGTNGNIAARALTILEKPTFGMWADYSDNEKFAVTNTAAALNGKNPESIEQAYKGFKKTIGTFDTLVTCRDYINKIYNLVDDHNNSLVSNIIVSDIRDDINRAHTLCSFGDYGIMYIEKANTEYTEQVQRSDLGEQPIDHFDLVLYPFKAYQQLNTIADFNNSFTYTDAKIPEIKANLADYKTISHNYCQPVGEEVVCIKNYLKLNARISTVNKVNSAEETLILNNIKSALYKTFNMHELDFGEEIPYDAILECIEGADAKIKGVILDEPILYTKFLTAAGYEYSIASTGLNTSGQSIYNKLALRNILAGRIELFKYDTAFKIELGEALYPDESYAPIYPTFNAGGSGSGSGSGGGSTTGGTAADQICYLHTECKKDLSEQVTDHKYLTLNSNEVIKFRAPSLKTVVPYSAYINYYLSLDSKITRAAEPARFISISKLWDLPITVSGLRQISSTDSFGHSFINFIITKGLLTVALGSNDFGTFLQHTTAITKESNEEAWNSLLQNTITSCLYYSSTDLRWSSFEPFSDFAVTSYNPITLKDKTTKTADVTFPAGYYFIVDLKNTDTVFNALRLWAKLFGLANYLQSDENILDRDELNSLANTFTTEAELPYQLVDFNTNPVQAIFKNLGVNSDRIPGQYINTNLEKFISSTQRDPSKETAWETYYWPAPRCVTQDGKKRELVPFEATADWTKAPWIDTTGSALYSGPSIGTDRVFNQISPLEEYELKENEHLYINYTPSNNTVDATGASSATTLPINLHYGAGTIIKPNELLTLQDSAARYSTGNYSWAKTTGFDFSAYPGGGGVEGMYSVGPNEQLDIRDFIEVNLSENVNLYWILENTVKLTGKKPEDLRFDECNSYTLKDGEYIFYTDKHKLDMAYYGSGTEIRATGNRVFTLANNITQVDLEEILVKGVAAVPWRTVTLDSNNYFTFREFQYITLTEGDFVRGLVLKNPEQTLTNEWTPVDSSTPCYYAFAGTSPINDGIALPKFNFVDKSIGWEARSLLELDIGPDKAQILHEGSSVTLLNANQQTIILGESATETDPETGEPKQLTTITPVKNGTPLAIKSNYPWKSANDTVKVVTVQDSAQDNVSQLYFRIKVFEDTPVATVNATIEDVTDNVIESLTDNVTVSLPLYNFNNLWTSIGAEAFHNTELETGQADTDIYNLVRAYATVPDNHYNLLMIYYMKSASQLEAQQGMGFRFYKYDSEAAGDKYTLDTEGSEIKIFNNLDISKFDGFIDKFGTSGSSGVINFNTYFDQLKWWTFNDLGHATLDGTAFGEKELPSVANLKNTDVSTDQIVEQSYRKISGVYFLKPGLNILVFKNSGKFEFFSEIDASGALRISDIDSIYADNSTADLGLNLELLDYQYTDETSSTEARLKNKTAFQLLKDLKLKDSNNEFYYNCPLQVATALDINTSLLGTADAERLSDPKFWYDTNNINNKFVISQIDADYLKTGLMIAKASKLK